MWLADCARRSALMADWPITVIPCSLDLNVWVPFDQRQARASLQAPQVLPLVLFVAMGGIALILARVLAFCWRPCDACAPRWLALLWNSFTW